MRITNIKEGQFVSLVLEDGTRYFLEALPAAITLKKMNLKIFPGKIEWEYKFPYYIRTAVEAWDLSIVLLKLIIDIIEDCKNSKELFSSIKTEVTPILNQWTLENKDDAYKLVIIKLGSFRVPKIE